MKDLELHKRLLRLLYEHHEEHVGSCFSCVGIIDEIYVDEGDEVLAGDLLAKIKVVPNEQALNSAEGRVKSSRIILNKSFTNSPEGVV